MNITEHQDARPFAPHEVDYIDLISNIAAAGIDEHLTRRARDEARDSIVVALARLAECRDADTGKHLDRVTRFCILLAKRLRSRGPHRAVITDEFLEDLGNLYGAIATEVTKHIELDLIAWWEDIAFKTGPIVPPDFFYNKCGPAYRRAMDVYTAHGTKYGYVDCDGDNRLLVPTWLDSGVNIIFPLEVNAGVHPEALRGQYPGIRMMGGFDKRILAAGPAAIDAEVDRLAPLAAEGGYIPFCDHRVPPDVPLRHYLHYLERAKQVFGRGVNVKPTWHGG